MGPADGLWEGSRVVGLAEGPLDGQWEGTLLVVMEGLAEVGRTDGAEEVGLTVGTVEG